METESDAIEYELTGVLVAFSRDEADDLIEKLADIVCENGGSIFYKPFKEDLD